MYDELVAWLRSWSELPAHCECYESCDECDKQDLCATFTNESIITKAGEAADAIEELEKASAHQSKKAKWEPVMATRISWGEPKVVQAEEEWYGRMFKCSSCGTEMIGDPKYCYGCGAEMENGKDYGDD